MRKHTRGPGLRRFRPLTVGTLHSAVEAAIGTTLSFVLPQSATQCLRSLVLRTLHLLVPNAPAPVLPPGAEPDDFADSICACARLLAQPDADEQSLLIAVKYVLLQIAAAANHVVLPLTFPAFRLRVLGGLLELEARATARATASPRMWQMLGRRAAALHAAYRTHTGKPLFILFPSSRTQAFLLLYGRLSDGETKVTRGQVWRLRQWCRAYRDRDGRILRSDDELRGIIDEGVRLQRTTQRKYGFVTITLGNCSIRLNVN